LYTKPEMSMNDLLSPKEVAALLRITTKTLRAHTQKGTIPQPVRLGPRTLRWSREVITAFMRGEVRS
jgi:excisionase family DNA binding protein